MSEPAPTGERDRSPLPSSYRALREQLAALIEIAPGELRPDDSLLDWGLDSVRAMTLLSRLKDAGVEIALVDFAESPTLRFLAGRLALEVA